jgi:hypothetical protein
MDHYRCNSDWIPFPRADFFVENFFRAERVFTYICGGGCLSTRSGWHYGKKCCSEVDGRLEKKGGLKWMAGWKKKVL